MRESGILMHLTSLPGPYGIGTMGERAFAFVDFLEDAGQSCWQILPLNPTGYGDSPYQSCSTFAGNHYLIDLEQLIRERLLMREEVDEFDWGSDPEKVDFGLQYRSKLQALEIAYSRFNGSKEFEDFRRENSSWLSDYSLFMALKEKLDGEPWYQWERGLKFRDPDVIWKARHILADRIRFIEFVQFQFNRQWKALRDYAHEKRIRIIGDVPIYVPYDSVEVWSNPELFQLNEDLTPTAVAGCPPDAFTADGQLWGNPLYRWDKMKSDGFGWWIRRLSAAAERYDMIRLDHFRGFEAYWSVPYGDKTARGGKWVKGPGMDFIGTLKEKLPELPVIAEDLGYLTPEVRALRDESGYPGMKVLGFAFNSSEPSEYLPHNYTRNTVCYTGTHDNMTMRQWFDTAEPEQRQYAEDYMGITEQEGPVWGTIRTAYASVSDLCIVPMQDYLDLGASGRMNFPGTLSDSNWTWRAKDGIINPGLSKRILRLSKLYCRNHGKKFT